MPFKGDERLGGPHDNEAKLNGSSDGPSVPVAGTFLRTENNVPWPIEYGGGYFDFVDANNQHYDVSNQTVTVSVKANGIGGEYYDWATYSNPQYRPFGYAIGVGQTTYTTQINVEISGFYYQVGEELNAYVHDGNGSFSSTNTSTNYSANGTFLVTTQGHDLYYDYYGTSFLIGTKDVNFYSNGQGGYYSNDGSHYPYPDNTVVGTRSGSTVTVYVSELSGYYNAGTEVFEVYVYQGAATDSGAAIGTDWYPQGTLITNGNYYYWNGDGTYYYSEPAPAAGTPTGNTSNGDISININGTDYNNGTYSGTEYHDGSGGTYWSYSNSYQPYGYNFTSAWIDDGNGGGYTEYYNSDGSGGYYTTT